MATAAVNDNGALAGDIVQALAQQTAELKIPPDRVALFNSAQMAESVRQAFTGFEGRTSSSGGPSGISVRPVVDQLASDNRVTHAQMERMLALQEEGIRAIRSGGNQTVQSHADGGFAIGGRSLRNA